MSQVLSFSGTEMGGLLDVLRQAVDLTSKQGERPAIVVNGKHYKPSELLKVAGLLPVECRNEGYKLARTANNSAGWSAACQRAHTFAEAEMKRQAN